MWLPPALLLLSLPGCFCIDGPKTVTGWERGLLTVECRYNRGWETYRKSWCRGAHWNTCRVLVQTTGSQKEVTAGRVSVRDDQRGQRITVTMRDLRRDDEDTYWCGIVKTDQRTSVTVIVQSENLSPGANANSSSGASSSSHVRHHYVLLLFLKASVLLALVGAILWLRGPQGAPEEPWEQPIYSNLSSDMTRDTAP